MTKPSGMPRSMSMITWFEPRCTLLPLHTWHLRFTSLPRPPHLLQLHGWHSVLRVWINVCTAMNSHGPHHRQGVRDFLPHDKAGRHLLVHLDHAAALAYRACVDVGRALRAGAAAMLAQHALIDFQLAASSGAGKRPFAASGGAEASVPLGGLPQPYHDGVAVVQLLQRHVHGVLQIRPLALALRLACTGKNARLQRLTTISATPWGFFLSLPTKCTPAGNPNQRNLTAILAID